jgi:hypothetical protein
LPRHSPLSFHAWQSRACYGPKHWRVMPFEAAGQQKT